MDRPDSTLARQIARAVSAFELERTGCLSQSVTVVLRDNALVIVLHQASSPAQRPLPKILAGAARVPESIRPLLATASDPLRDQIEIITGVELREANGDDEAIRCAVMERVPSDTVVLVFLFAQIVPANSWSGRTSSKEFV